MERGPAVSAASIVEAQATLGGLEVSLEEDRLHGVGVAALGGEEEAGAADDTISTEGEEGGDLSTSGDGTGSNNGRTVGAESSLDGLDDGEEGRRNRSTMASSFVACRHVAKGKVSSVRSQSKFIRDQTLHTLGNDNIDLPHVRGLQSVFRRVDDGKDLGLVGALRVVLVDNLDVLAKVTKGEPDRLRLLLENGGDTGVVRGLGHVENPPDDTHTEGDRLALGDVEFFADDLEGLPDLLRRIKA